MGMYLRKFNEHSVATAFASNVLPVPGGPYSNIPKIYRQLSIKHLINQLTSIHYSVIHSKNYCWSTGEG